MPPLTDIEHSAPARQTWRGSSPECHTALKQEHSNIIGTLRQLTARREALEVEQDRINRIRKATLSRPPPTWMRRLATKLQVPVKWTWEVPLISSSGPLNVA